MDIVFELYNFYYCVLDLFVGVVVGIGWLFVDGVDGVKFLVVVFVVCEVVCLG